MSAWALLALDAGRGKLRIRPGTLPEPPAGTGVAALERFVTRRHLIAVRAGWNEFRVRVHGSIGTFG